MENPDQPLPVVIYAAKSTPDEKESTASQVERVRDRLKQEGERAVRGEPFTEDNVSAYKGSRGPALEAAIRAATEAASEHGAAELWVFHSTRVARGSGLPNHARSLMEVFTDLRRAGVTLRSVEDDAFVTNQMLVGVASELAHKYSADLAAHVKRGKRAQFDRGERLGGPVPDGYLPKVRIESATREYVIDEERAPIIRRAVELGLDGLGAGAVARRLNQEGHRRKSGKPWNRRRVQDMLSNPFYASRVAMFRGTDRERVQPGNWPSLIEPDVFDRIQLLTAARDKATKSHDKRTGVGRPTTRYALAKLATCGRCDARMYAVTSPYKRKDGSHQRSYICGNTKDSTGMCDQPALDAAKIDASVVDHLNRLFIDFEAWLTELARGQEQQRTAVDGEVASKLDELAKVNAREAKLRARYFHALDDDQAEPAAYELYQHVLKERETLQEAVRALQEALAAEPDQPPVDSMLDVYNNLVKAVRGGEGEGIRDLNDRLHGVFQEFGLDEVATGVICIVPILRDDVIERYGDSIPVMIGPDGMKPLLADVPDAVPLVLFAGDQPPQVEGNEPNTHE